MKKINFFFVEFYYPRFLTQFFNLKNYKIKICSLKKLSQEDSKSYNLIMQIAKKSCSLHFKCKYLAIYVVKIPEISFTHSYTSLA